MLDASTNTMFYQIRISKNIFSNLPLRRPFIDRCDVIYFYWFQIS